MARRLRRRPNINLGPQTSVDGGEAPQCFVRRFCLFPADKTSLR